jgi:serine/threonine protein kinase
MMTYDCPYTVGAEFVLIVHHPPGYSRPTGTPGEYTIRAKVLQTFTFTRSQTMQVEIMTKPNCSNLPSVAFLKLYDRRYLADRLLPDAKDPWNPQLEAEAEKTAQKIQMRLNARLDSGTVPLSRISLDDGNLWEEIEDCGSDDDYEDELDQMDECDVNAAQQWIKEKDHVYYTNRWFKTECKAYRRLESLQGHCIPKFYGAITFDKSWLGTPQGIDTEVRGILLEFIHGVSLEEVDSESPITFTHPHLGQAAVHLFEKIVPLGVLHGDVRLANIMVQDDGRVFLLDFALATLRERASSEEIWNEWVNSDREVDLIKYYLDEHELRDRTPPEPYEDTFEGFRSYNRLIENAREHWRMKYYESIPQKFDVDIREFDNGQNYFYYKLRWRLKHESAVARRRALNSYIPNGSLNTSSPLGL